MTPGLAGHGLRGRCGDLGRRHRRPRSRRSRRGSPWSPSDGGAPGGARRRARSDTFDRRLHRAGLTLECVAASPGGEGYACPATAPAPARHATPATPAPPPSR